MMAVLRVRGEVFDVDGYLVAQPAIRPDKLWHKGDRLLGGKVYPTNGFNLALAEEASWSAVRDGALKMVAQLQPALAVAQTCGGEVELDFSVEAVETGTFTVSCRLSPENMAFLSSVGITFCLTVYPPSENGERSR